MTRSNRSRLLASALFGVFCTMPALAQDADHDMAGMNHAAPVEPGSPSANYMAAMKTMDEAMGAMTMTGDPGIDFAEMMIPHHRSAIAMAKAYLASNHGDPLLSELSNEIVASQEAEIAKLEGWLAANKAK